MILDLLQMTANSHATEEGTLDAFEVLQYLQLADEIELHMSMGSGFDEAYGLACETSSII